MNCQYWDYRYPRMLTISQMQDLVERGENRLLAVGDISCDRGVRNIPMCYLITIN
jgi:alpha-aminoadipic semialdehyde synthase